MSPRGSTEFPVRDRLCGDSSLGAQRPASPSAWDSPRRTAVPCGAADLPGSFLHFSHATATMTPGADMSR